MRCFEVTPRKMPGWQRDAPLEEIKGKTPDVDMRAMTEALSGVENSYRNAVVYNAAAGLLIAGKVADLKAGAAMAKEAIDSSRAYGVLKKLVEVSNVR